MSTQTRFEVLPLLDAQGVRLTVRLASVSAEFLAMGRLAKRIGALRVADIEGTSIVVVTGGTGEAGSEARTLTVYVSDGVQKAEVASLTVETLGERAAQVVAEQLEPALQDAYQSAIFDAIGKLHEQRMAAATAGLLPIAGLATAGGPATFADVQTVTPATGRKLVTRGRVIFAAVIAVAFAFVAYGLVHKQAAPADTLAAGIDPQMAQRIQQQIAQSLSQPSSNGGILQGQSVTVDTLRAMGLNPGKANTGCLVGVKK